jgi:hypothetical protein
MIYLYSCSVMPTESPTDDIAKRIGSAVLAASVGEARTTGQDSRIRKKDVIDFDDSCAFARIAEISQNCYLLIHVCYQERG